MDTTTSRSERREHWREVVGQWQGSGESQAGFCRERGLAAWQFRYWLRRLTAEGSPAAVGHGFAEVSSPGGGLRLRLPGGLVLEIGPEFDEATLRRFLRAAAGPC